MEYDDYSNPYKKIKVHEGQYLYSYQLKFISGLVSDRKFSIGYFKKSIVSYSLYNFLNDYLKEVDDKAGFFFWDSEEEEFNFQTEDDKLCAALEEAGYVDVWDEL